MQNLSLCLDGDIPSMNLTIGPSLYRSGRAALLSDGRYNEFFWKFSKWFWRNSCFPSSFLHLSNENCHVFYYYYVLHIFLQEKAQNNLIFFASKTYLFFYVTISRKKKKKEKVVCVTKAFFYQKNPFLKNLTSSPWIDVIRHH